MKTRRATAILVASLGLYLALYGAAAANGGPHGAYDRLGMTGGGSQMGCQACHTPHRAQADSLLRATTIYDLCTTCHGPGGERTDVVDGTFNAGGGIYLTPDSYGADDPAAGIPVYSHQLNGGRFGNGAQSWHKVKSDEENTARIIYGSSATDATDVSTSLFKCTSCHDPHGNKLSDVGATSVTLQDNGSTENYRMLKYKPVYSFENVNTTGNGVAGANKSYTKQALEYQGRNEPASGITRFCATCHTDYRPTAPDDPRACQLCHSGLDASKAAPLAPGGHRYVHKVDVFVHPGGADWVQSNLSASSFKLPVEHEAGQFESFYATGASDPKAANAAVYVRFIAGNPVPYDYLIQLRVNCLTCHDAHGSTATDSGSANGSIAYNRAGTASLLRFDERAVCQSCHKMNPSY